MKGKMWAPLHLFVSLTLLLASGTLIKAEEKIATIIVDAAIQVHRALGPGL